ncbi:MAG TPA: CBS domain-containing protein [Opitutaceae bacterium]|nr:CBS domain-containing protein [Opitutaceae bacterium]
MNTPVATLLGRKGSAVHTVTPSQTVADAVRVMNEKKIGSLVIVEGRRLAGIFTERDVLSRVVAAGVDPRTTRVSAVMSVRLETIGPETTIGDVMSIFTNKRCRHLPVVADGELLGLISIGDVSRWLVDTHQAECEQLRQYIAGGYPT